MVTVQCVAVAEQGWHSAKTLSSNHLCTPKASRLGVGKSLGGDQLGQLTRTHQRDIPYHTMPCLAIRAKGKEEVASTFLITAFVFPGNHYGCRGPAFQEVAGHLSADRK